MTDTKIFVAWDDFTKEDFESFVETNNGSSIIIWAPENIGAPQLFRSFDEYQDMKEFLSIHSIEWRLVSGAMDNSFYGDDDRIIYWSDFQLYNMAARMTSSEIAISVYPSIQKLEKPYQYSKIQSFDVYSFVFIDELAKRNLIEKGMVTITDRGSVPMSSRYKLQHWVPEIIENQYTKNRYYSRIVENENLFRVSPFEFGTTPPADFPIMGETFAYALLTGRFPVMYAGQHMYHILKHNVGIDIFDDIIDYSFDNTPKDNPFMRIDLLGREMEKICNLYDASPRLFAENTISRSALNLQKIALRLSNTTMDTRILDIIGSVDELTHYKSIVENAARLAIIGNRAYVTKGDQSS